MHAIFTVGSLSSICPVPPSASRRMSVNQSKRMKKDELSMLCLERGKGGGRKEGGRGVRRGRYTLNNEYQGEEEEEDEASPPPPPFPVKKQQEKGEKKND